MKDTAQDACPNCNGTGHRWEASGEQIPCDLCSPVDAPRAEFTLKDMEEYAAARIKIALAQAGRATHDDARAVLAELVEASGGGSYWTGPILERARSLLSAAQEAPDVKDAPEGWRFYSADFSINAANPASAGHVTLIRDFAGVRYWHSLTEERQAETPLFVSGEGMTFASALVRAVEAAIAATPTKET